MIQKCAKFACADTLRVFVSSLHIALLHCTLMACHVLLGCLFGTYFVLSLGELLVFLQY